MRRRLNPDREDLLAALPRHLQDVAGELDSWLPSESEEFKEFFWRFLASLPGGEAAQDMGYDPLTDMIGWKEAELLENTLKSIQTNADVEDLISYCRNVFFRKGLKCKLQVRGAGRMLQRKLFLNSESCPEARGLTADEEEEE